MSTVVQQAYELVPVAQLSAHPDNPRRGNEAEIGASIAANGFYGAVVAQRSTGHVLAGNHRLRAAQAAGIDQLPVIWVDADDERAKRILLADNRTADLATNDEAALLALLEGMALTPELLAGTGYDMDTMDDLRAAVGTIPVDEATTSEAHYAETAEDEAARLARRGQEPSIHEAGLREMVLVYPVSEHQAIGDLISRLRGALGADATTSDVVAAALRVAVTHVDEMAPPA